MRIAIPIAGGKLSMHFGHCERFALIDVDPTEKKILKREDIEAPRKLGKLGTHPIFIVPYPCRKNSQKNLFSTNHSHSAVEIPKNHTWGRIAKR